jgi:hypothetical protein
MSLTVDLSATTDPLRVWAKDITSDIGLHPPFTMLVFDSGDPSGPRTSVTITLPPHMSAVASMIAEAFNAHMTNPEAASTREHLAKLAGIAVPDGSPRLVVNADIGGGSHDPAG